MADYAPPSGPPPPKVPQGWKAVWNDQYKEWFYVNIYTKQSQWDKPTEPVYPPSDTDAAPDGPPPGYNHGAAKATGPEKGGLDSNNPFRKSQQDITEDERLARQLQEEENRRAGGSGVDRGESDSYYGGDPHSQPSGAGVTASHGAGELPPRPDQDRGSKGKGILGKLFNKNKTPHAGQQYPPPQGYGGYPQQPGYGPGPGYPPQGGYYPPQGYGGYPPQQAYGRRPGGGGMGTAGAAALGVGGGLLGGALLADAFDGGDDGGYGGDDGGGGDFGGGDF